MGRPLFGQSLSSDVHPYTCLCSLCTTAGAASAPRTSSPLATSSDTAASSNPPPATAARSDPSDPFDDFFQSRDELRRVSEALDAAYIRLRAIRDSLQSLTDRMPPSSQNPTVSTPVAPAEGAGIGPAHAAIVLSTGADSHPSPPVDRPPPSDGPRPPQHSDRYIQISWRPPPMRAWGARNHESPVAARSALPPRPYASRLAATLDPPASSGQGLVLPVPHANILDIFQRSSDPSDPSTSRGRRVAAREAAGAAGATDPRPGSEVRRDIRLALLQSVAHIPGEADVLLREAARRSAARASDATGTSAGTGAGRGARTLSGSMATSAVRPEPRAEGPLRFRGFDFTPPAGFVARPTSPSGTDSTNERLLSSLRETTVLLQQLRSPGPGAGTGTVPPSITGTALPSVPLPIPGASLPPLPGLSTPEDDAAAAEAAWAGEYDPSDRRSYRIRRRLNADGEEHVQRVELPDGDDPMEWLMPRRERLAPRTRLATGRRTVARWNAAASDWAAGEAVSDVQVPTAVPLPTSRRGWARLDPDGNEVPTDEEEDIARYTRAVLTRATVPRRRLVFDALSRPYASSPFDSEAARETPPVEDEALWYSSRPPADGPVPFVPFPVRVEGRPESPAPTMVFSAAMPFSPDPLPVPLDEMMPARKSKKRELEREPRRVVSVSDLAWLADR